MLTTQAVVAMGRQALEMLLMMVGPLLLVALVIGTLVSILQAVTQVQETTLTFLPKLVAVALALVILGPWMLTMLVDYLRRTIESIPSVVG